MVGADVLGGPCLWAFSWASPLARRAEDVAPYHVVRTGADTMGTW